MKTQSPEEVKIKSLRDYFEGICDSKFESLCLVMRCIFFSQTCNLNKAARVAPLLGEKANKKALHARLVRFFSTGIGNTIQQGVVQAVLNLGLQSGKPCALAIDRTNWKRGEQWHNLLVLGLCFEGYLIPLVWVDLGHQGNSEAKLRLHLLRNLAALWPEDALPLKSFPLVGDREFAGEQWLAEVIELGFDFVVRIKCNRKMMIWLNNELRDKAVRLTVLQRYLNSQNSTYAEVLIAGLVFCHFVFLPNADKRDKDSWIFLITSLDKAQLAGDYYRIRWSIECCFKHLKTNGFNLESQNLHYVHQVEILMAVLVLLYTISTVQGLLQRSIERAKRPKSSQRRYQNGTQYDAQSTFSLGVDRLFARVATSFYDLLNIFKELMHYPSTTYASG